MIRISRLAIKYVFSTSFTFVVCNASSGQETPKSPYASTVKINHVRVWDAKAAETNEVTLRTRVLRDVVQTTQYFDGLGRPLQTVVKNGSLQTGSSPTDLTSPVQYDGFNREQLKYLPFASTENSGLLKLNPFQQQVSFYNTQLTGQVGETNIGAGLLNWAYSMTNFEPSPLNRPADSYAPGVSWLGTKDAATKRNVKVTYLSNTVSDKVRIWKVNVGAVGAFSTYATTLEYPAGELSKLITTDERGKQVIEFKDKNGRIILKKVQFSAADDLGGGSDHPGWFCTYYLYDDYGNLRCVIQPRGVELVSTTYAWVLTNATVLAEQCFRYEYDQRQRMIVKKVPGAGEVYMVYDARDRLVMTQDAVMLLAANNKWLVTLYDEQNRPVQTGMLLNTWNGKTFAQHRTAAYSVSDYPFTAANTPATTYWEYYTKAGYDDYSQIPPGSGLDNSLVTAFTTSPYTHTTYNTSPEYAEEPLASKHTKGLVTWMEEKVLGTTTYLYRVNIYDQKARVIQVKSKNISSGTDILTTQYNWAGQPIRVIQKIEKAGTGAQTTVTVTKLDYDDLGRVSQTDKKIQNTNVNSNSLPSAWTTTNKNEYDALGQLKKKKLGNKPGAAAGTPLAKLDIAYNVRGWLLSINKDFIGATNNDQYFAMEIGYDKNSSIGAHNAQYNGNIGGIIWKSQGDQQLRKYDFTYDAVNRLNLAYFTQYVSGSGSSATFDKSAGIDFSERGITYDANGNILTLSRTGLKFNNSPTIDSLLYTLTTNTNKLLKVYDRITGTDNGKLGDFKDGTSGSGNDYTYDVNGSMITDNNKTISANVYNYLNLPTLITTTKGTIAYEYSASGLKQRKTVTENNATVNYGGTNYVTNISTVTTYLGAVVMESKTYSIGGVLQAGLGYADKLLFLGHEEGRVRFEQASGVNCPATLNRLVYDYFLKDHLGNVRSVLTEQNEEICYIPASVEDATYTTEDDIYNIVDTRRILTSTAGASGGNFQSKVYRTHGGLANEKTGLGMVLKVMSGDKVRISAESFYTLPGTAGNPVDVTVAELLGAFVGSPGLINAKGVLTTTDVSNLGTNFTQLDMINNGNPGTTIAKAYVNWILFDDQLKFVSSGSDPVQNNGGYKQHVAWATTPMLATKNGFLYIYACPTKRSTGG